MKKILELFITFSKIGLFTFGGGYAMISLIDNECAGKKRWITSDEMEEMTVIAESTPGPIAINCATYVGWKQAKIAGAAAATFGVVLPSFIIVFIISLFFENLLDHPIADKAFKGIRVAVAVLIIRAAVKMTSKMLKTPKNRAAKTAFCAAAFGITFLLNLLGVNFSSIFLILISGFFGFVIFGLVKKGAKK